MHDSQRPIEPYVRRLDGLKPRDKEPTSKAMLDKWIFEAQEESGLEAGRLSHLVAATVAIAVLQRVIEKESSPKFLLKGGTYLQHRLPNGSRATRDIDGLVRGDLNDFLKDLDQAIEEPWGEITFRRTAAERIELPTKIIKPYRFQLKLEIRGRVWRSLQIEISPDEAGAGNTTDLFQPAQLHYFGLKTPGEFFGLSLRFQVAQKLHACTDPHEPPSFINDRARDLADLILLRSFILEMGEPTLSELRTASEAVFEGRAQEGQTLGKPSRLWPPIIIAHIGWEIDYKVAAKEAGIDLDLASAITVLTNWIAEIAHSQ